MPPGASTRLRASTREVVGLERIERPETLGGVGAWFRAGVAGAARLRVRGFAPAPKAHPAFELTAAELDALAERLAAAGADVQLGRAGLPGARRFYSFDPAGNRLEFLTRE